MSSTCRLYINVECTYTYAPGSHISLELYSCLSDHLPEFGTEQSVVGADVLGDCQDVVIRWFTTFVQSSRSLSLPEANK